MTSINYFQSKNFSLEQNLIAAIIDNAVTDAVGFTPEYEFKKYIYFVKKKMKLFHLLMRLLSKKRLKKLLFLFFLRATESRERRLMYVNLQKRRALAWFEERKICEKYFGLIGIDADWGFEKVYEIINYYSKEKLR